MDFKTTFTKRRRCRGFTLVELMIACGLASLVLTATAAISVHSGRSLAALANYAELEQQSRSSLDRITQEIRQSRGVVSGSPESITLRVQNGETVEFARDPVSQSLLRRQGDAVETLLTQCDNLKFEYFQRTPKGSGYEVFPTATAAATKMVQVTWTCSRKILGETVNTELVQSARIVIRKRN